MASMGWQWASINPGTTVLPPRSTSRVEGPASFLISSALPDLQDLAVLDGHRADRGARGIQRDDLAVKVDRFRLCCRCTC